MTKPIGRERFPVTRPIFTGDPELLTVKEVAEIIRVPWKRCYELLGDIAIELGPRTIRWRRADVLQWLEDRSRGRRVA